VAGTLFYFLLAMLKLIADFGTLLIEAEGTGFQRETRVKGKTPHAFHAEKLTDRPRFAKCLERKPTGKFNRAFL
jgi:hypothetical protein